MMKNLPTNEQQDNLPARHCWPADPQRVPSQPRIRVAREQVERRIVCRAFHRYISHNRILRRFGLVVVDQRRRVTAISELGLMNIVVLDGYTLNPGDNPWRDLDELGSLTAYDRTKPDELLSRAFDADILLTNKTPIGREQVAHLPKLKFISVLATGYNVVDVVALQGRGIPVSNVPSYGTDSVAQHVMAMLLELCNHVGEHSRSVSAGEWASCPDFCYWKHSSVDLLGLSLGIVGLGRIGLRVAELGLAFGMKLLYAAPTPKKNLALPIVHRPLEQLFAEADIVSLHCTQTAENYQFVNRNLLSLMKPSAFLINTARGTLVNESHLAQALGEKQITGAALDVLSVEPPLADNPLIGAPNCLITPHMAWSSLSARKRLMQITVGNVRAFLA